MIGLGFNDSRMHDSFACAVRDGGLLFLMTEEWIERRNLTEEEFSRWKDVAAREMST
jgi:hypothetical protein